MASTSHKREEVAASPNTAKEFVSETLPSPRVVLNPADCDLDFTIESDGVVGYGLNEEGFSYCWSGARANVGIFRGKYCFGCKIVSQQRVVMDDVARERWYLLHLGFSRGDVALGNLVLGESKNSYSIRGKMSNDGSSLIFWNKYDVGDTIVCCVDFERKPRASIHFFENGIPSGCYIRFDVTHFLGLGGGNSSPSPGSFPWGLALFPHVLLKNIKVEMQFSVEDGLVPQEGFKPWALAVADGNAVMGPVLSKRTDCEVTMMVGLPTSGKTTWAQKFVKDHPEKRYVLLVTNSILDRMKDRGPGLRRNNDDDDDVIGHPWKDRATEILNRMLSMAATVPRNYIIEQRNYVYLNTRRDELMPFADFQKIAVVVVPNAQELVRRSEIRFKETGRSEVIGNCYDMIANFVLPKSKDVPDTNECEDFDQVIFVELNRDESHERLDNMKRNLNI